MSAIYGIILNIDTLSIVLFYKVYRAFCLFIPGSVLLLTFLSFRNPDNSLCSLLSHPFGLMRSTAFVMYLLSFY